MDGQREALRLGATTASAGPGRAGDRAPDGPVLEARTPDLGAKQALLAERPDIFYTIPHFQGHPAVLVRLETISTDDLRELLVEAWLARAPKTLVREFLQHRW